MAAEQQREVVRNLLKVETHEGGVQTIASRPDDFIGQYDNAKKKKATKVFKVASQEKQPETSSSLLESPKKKCSNSVASARLQVAHIGTPGLDVEAPDVVPRKPPLSNDESDYDDVVEMTDFDDTSEAMFESSFVAREVTPEMLVQPERTFQTHASSEFDDLPEAPRARAPGKRPEIVRGRSFDDHNNPFGPITAGRQGRKKVDIPDTFTSKSNHEGGTKKKPAGPTPGYATRPGVTRGGSFHADKEEPADKNPFLEQSIFANRKKSKAIAQPPKEEEVTVEKLGPPPKINVGRTLVQAQAEAEIFTSAKLINEHPDVQQEPTFEVQDPKEFSSIPEAPRAKAPSRRPGVTRGQSFDDHNNPFGPIAGRSGRKDKPPPQKLLSASHHDAKSVKKVPDGPRPSYAARPDVTRRGSFNEDDPGDENPFLKQSIFADKKKSKAIVREEPQELQAEPRAEEDKDSWIQSPWAKRNSLRPTKGGQKLLNGEDISEGIKSIKVVDEN
jgi:hypothetical protein